MVSSDVFISKGIPPFKNVSSTKALWPSCVFVNTNVPPSPCLSLQAGREGRDKFGVKKGKLNPKSSTTNKEKMKTKAYTMIVHKKKSKSKRSFREKQVSLHHCWEMV